jgi:NAD-dependent dihydropyrimidine dehydrogenase PreA subunit
MERVSRNKPPAGLVVIAPEACKGCGLCVNACPVKVLRLSDGFNAHGYHPAAYNGSGCTGCGICFYACPEPGAITVYVRAKSPSFPLSQRGMKEGFLGAKNSV